MSGNDTRIQLVREVFDALLVDKPVLPFMTEQDFLNAKVPVGLARHLANAIAARSDTTIVLNFALELWNPEKMKKNICTTFMERAKNIIITQYSSTPHK